MKKIYLFLNMLWFGSHVFAQKQEIISSNFLPHADSVSIFSPKKYDVQKKYPLLVMLHGWSGNSLQWSEITDLQAYADSYGFVIVCPDGFFDSWYLDSPINKKLQYQQFMIKDLLPFVEKKYSLDKKNYFITGLSMGGYGALSIYLKNLDIFKSAGSTSGAVDLRPYHKRFGLEKVLGEYDEKKYLDYSILGQIQLLKNSPKNFIFDCGSADVFHKNNVELSRFCVENQIKATFISQTGKHDKAYWKKAIKAHFDFFQKQVSD